MINSAKHAIEEIYSFTLNPNEDYYQQLQSLAAGGELANHNSTSQVLFKLAMILDAQIKELFTLKNEKIELANKVQELEEKLNGKATHDPKPDPTAPIQP